MRILKIHRPTNRRIFIIAGLMLIVPLLLAPLNALAINPGLEKPMLEDRDTSLGDIWTNKGCKGSNQYGGVYEPGEYIEIYFKVSFFGKVVVRMESSVSGIHTLFEDTVGPSSTPYRIRTMAISKSTLKIKLIRGRTQEVIDSCTVKVGQPIKGDIWTNRGGKGSGTSGGVFEVGEPVKISFSVNEDAEVMVYARYPDGRKDYLFEGRVQGGKTKTITKTFPKGIYSIKLQLIMKDSGKSLDSCLIKFSEPPSPSPTNTTTSPTTTTTRTTTSSSTTTSSPTVTTSSTTTTVEEVILSPTTTTTRTTTSSSTTTSSPTVTTSSTTLSMTYLLFLVPLLVPPVILLVYRSRRTQIPHGDHRPSPSPESPATPSLPLTLSLRLPPRKEEPYEGTIHNYLLVSKLGEGGYSTVYRARHRYMGREVALKVMDYTEAFERELKSLKGLDHPHILRILDAGVEGDKHYLALELGDGDLNSLQSPLPDQEAAKLGYALASALRYAHSLNIVHGDVKPSNVILVKAEKGKGYIPKLADFSIARVMAEESGTLTMSTGLKGTLGYLDPALVRKYEGGEKLKFEDHVKADIYSLGMTLGGVIRPDSALKPLIAEMTSPFPRDRPSLNEILDALAKHISRS